MEWKDLDKGWGSEEKGLYSCLFYWKRLRKKASNDQEVGATVTELVHLSFNCWPPAWVDFKRDQLKLCSVTLSMVPRCVSYM